MNYENDPTQSPEQLQRPDMAPGASYGEDGPQPMSGPDGGPESQTYEGALPVLQWQIDPHDAASESGTANLKLGDWDFRVWCVEKITFFISGESFFAF